MRNRLMRFPCQLIGKELGKMNMSTFPYGWQTGYGLTANKARLRISRTAAAMSG